MGEKHFDAILIYLQLDNKHDQRNQRIINQQRKNTQSFQ